VNTSHYPTVRRDPQPYRGRGRLTLNEQLCLFAPVSEAGPSEVSYGSWAALALALIIVPWALIGWMIWMLI
jgi:hypothetical protein